MRVIAGPGGIRVAREGEQVVLQLANVRARLSIAAAQALAARLLCACDEGAQDLVDAADTAVDGIRAIAGALSKLER